MTLREYFKKKQINYKDFYDKVLVKYPIKFTKGTWVQWYYGRKFPHAESAFFVSEATKGELTIDEILFPPDRRKKLKSMIRENRKLRSQNKAKKIA